MERRKILRNPLTDVTFKGFRKKKPIRNLQERTQSLEGAVEYGVAKDTNSSHYAVSIFFNRCELLLFPLFLKRGFASHKNTVEMLYEDVILRVE